jgi:hypothetical protein
LIEYTPSYFKDSVISSGGEEYTIVDKGNVQIYFGGKMIIFLNVYCVPCMELNFISVSQIVWHNPELDVNFSNHKCYIVDKETKKIASLGVKNHILFKLVDIGQVREHALTTKSASDISIHYCIRGMGSST